MTWTNLTSPEDKAEIQASLVREMDAVIQEQLTSPMIGAYWILTDFTEEQLVMVRAFVNSFNKGID